MADNFGNSPATMLRGIAKVRMRDQYGKQYYMFRGWNPVDCLPVGYCETITFSFPLDDHNFLQHCVEITRMQKESGGYLNYAKEISNMLPSIEIYMLFSNINGGKYLLTLSGGFKYLDDDIGNVFSKWLIISEEINIEKNKEIQLHNQTTSIELMDKLFAELEEYSVQKVGQQSQKELEVVVYETVVKVASSSDLELFMKEWDIYLGNSSNELDCLKVDDKLGRDEGT